MALPRPLNRLELALPSTSTTAGGSPADSLASLSQRKLNALGLPLAYVDRNQRYRFVNKAFLEWTGKRLDRRDRPGGQRGRRAGAFPLYDAYVDAALAGERTGFERQLTVPGRPPIWIRVDYYPDRGAEGEVRGFLVTLQPTSTS